MENRRMHSPVRGNIFKQNTWSACRNPIVWLVRFGVLTRRSLNTALLF